MWSLLSKFGVHIELSWTWAVSISRRMGFVQRRGSTQIKAKLSNERISKLKHTYLSQIEGMVKAHNILSELVINCWSESGHKTGP